MNDYERYMVEIKNQCPDIVLSETFLNCRNQKQHMKSNVLIHTYHVTFISLKICDFLEWHGFQIDRKRMIKSALCHDLGLCDFKKKYGFKTHFIKAWQHPKDSLNMARFITSIDEKTAMAITRHMYPLCIMLPGSIEGWVLTTADKLCAVYEAFY